MKSRKSKFKIRFKINLKEREKVMKLFTGLEYNSALNISRITGFNKNKVTDLIESYYREKMANKLEVQYEIV